MAIVEINRLLGEAETMKVAVESSAHQQADESLVRTFQVHIGCLSATRGHTLTHDTSLPMEYKILIHVAYDNS